MTNALLLLVAGGCLMVSLVIVWRLIEQCIASQFADRMMTRVQSALPHSIATYLEQLWLRSQQNDLTGSDRVQTLSRWLLQRIIVVLAVFALVMIPQPNSQRLLVILVVGVCLLRRQQQRRFWADQIERQWPATIDIYAMLLLSGLSQRAAIYSMAALPNPSRATWLLQRVQRDIRTGTDLEAALNQLSQSHQSVWIQHFVTASIQSLRYGSQLAETLFNQADEARQKQIIDAEKRAQEVGVKLLFPLLFCFFPVTFLIILGPLVLRFLQGG